MIHYKAKGSPEVALRIEQLLQQHSIPTGREFHRGLDHGTWVILNSLFPEANIPVVQCSIDGHQSSVEHHFRIGQAVAPLAHENVLVIGSGVTVHNLRKMNWKGGEKQHVQKWVFDFDQWLIDQLLQQRNVKNLFDYEKLAPNARDAVPSEDHFVPLFVPMGMGFSGEFEEATTKRLEPPSISSSVQPQVLERFYDFGCLSYLVISF
ncbi:hypothetical protein C9374_003565 [Naegleria lovaniensis]|uniref:Extradiol ring-cleavage dioxygenase class III enzyme subunit B domain-containing protein n=1 Tax=Naegleria lovaniensis TaxID=51637 RepID=A0AA88KS25_NAELO|nr:uncharacterized protein C9374_003565 [Naegleria lovaniensis]KAG2393801.1 hypothetical protein C9374_003565 [Naegleria lovaniensis]